MKRTIATVVALVLAFGLGWAGNERTHHPQRQHGTSCTKTSSDDGWGHRTTHTTCEPT